MTGAPAAVYYFLLWVVPLLTSFSFFMILRQLVQHGNGDHCGPPGVADDPEVLRRLRDVTCPA